MDLHDIALAAALAKGSGGGGGGTTDYTDLTNKPSINSVTLSGNKTTADLGIMETWVGTQAQYVSNPPATEQPEPHQYETKLRGNEQDYTAP